jgi:hypothetical protein
MDSPFVWLQVFIVFITHHWNPRSFPSGFGFDAVFKVAYFCTVFMVNGKGDESDTSCLADTIRGAIS